jgi:HAD superfamily hydrolase (TIGR01549 family)
MSDIRFLLFDAANTLIHKPTLWTKMDSALQLHNINIDLPTLQRHHKLISEVLFFPDRTSAEFYNKFNGELLYSLGIIPTEAMLNDIFKACTYQPWEVFEDTDALAGLDLPKAILSNFNTTLAAKIGNMFPGVFSTIITSEEMQCAKPSLEFYGKAIEAIGLAPKHILYVGDSLKLDMEPAIKLGMNAWLIDRAECYPNYPNRITSFHQLAAIYN